MYSKSKDTHVKKMHATKKLQETLLYKEAIGNLQSYYQLSLKKEQKQQSYSKRICRINKNTGEVTSPIFSFEKHHKTYTKTMMQKITVLEHTAKELDLVPIFMTITLPSKYHPFAGRMNKGKYTYTNINPNFSFDFTCEAINSGYRELNTLFRTFYKRVKGIVGQVIYIKVFEPHITMIPHLHVLFFVEKYMLQSVSEEFEKLVFENELEQVDFSESSCKDDIRSASAYMRKYITKELNSGEDAFEARVIDGWKKEHKIRIISTSNTELSTLLYQKIYFNIPPHIKELMNKYMERKKISFFQFLQWNTQIIETLVKEEKYGTEIEKKVINTFQIFRIEIHKTRKRKNGVLVYNTEGLVIRFLEKVIYDKKNYVTERILP